MNKYQEAFNEVKEHITSKHHWWSTEDERNHLATLQELVDKETPMKVDKEHYKLEDCAACDYFPVSVHLYKCPNTRCRLHKRYELCFEEKRCPECNQLLDWGGKKHEKNK